MLETSRQKEGWLLTLDSTYPPLFLPQYAHSTLGGLGRPCLSVGQVGLDEVGAGLRRPGREWHGGESPKLRVRVLGSPGC
jgi:hypothetical protein